MKNKLTQEEAKEFVKGFAMPKRSNNRKLKKFKFELPSKPDTQIYCALIRKFGKENLNEKCGMLKERPGYNCVQICHADFYMGKRTKNYYWEIYEYFTSFDRPDPEYPEIKCVKSDCTIDTASGFHFGQCINTCYWYPGGRE